MSVSAQGDLNHYKHTSEFPDQMHEVQLQILPDERHPRHAANSILCPHGGWPPFGRISGPCHLWIRPALRGGQSEHISARRQAGRHLALSRHAAAHDGLLGGRGAQPTRFCAKTPQCRSLLPFGQVSRLRVAYCQLAIHEAHEMRVRAGQGRVPVVGYISRHTA